MSTSAACNASNSRYGRMLSLRLGVTAVEDCSLSSCIYPRLAPQPIREEYLLTGPLEATNEAYGIAKITGLKMAAAYRVEYGCSTISFMPTNLYGPGDNFNLQTPHVVPRYDSPLSLSQECWCTIHYPLGHQLATARVPPCR